jgi:hypothetical protein
MTNDTDNFQEKIGEGLVRIGAINQQQCEHVLNLQKQGDARLFGEIALSLGYLDFKTLMEFLSGKKGS